MEHLGTKELQTERLILRQLTINDTESVYNNWANDDEVTHYLSWPTHKDKNVTKDVLEN
jgi:[ribosomal protein S5]-alanine N-acetyltransferase